MMIVIYLINMHHQLFYPKSATDIYRIPTEIHTTIPNDSNHSFLQIIAYFNYIFMESNVFL